MIKLARLSILAAGLVAAAAGAYPTMSSRFVHDASGYVVETRDLGGSLRISGRHPETGKTFKVKVSGNGHIVGTWEGRPVDYVLGAARSDVQMARAAAAGAAAK